MEEIRDSDIQNEDYLIPLFLNEQGILQEMDTSVEESSKEYDEYRHDAFFASHFRLKEAFVKEAA
ncbi:hypothetical protein [Xenococcus sp. PCC 7305]|uniref:hypothetical protein n=1 Tax=Xenococcus sp. PCC 7305 TaxID=102125 RepID=UPI0002E06510|nr:hypothetical protein [Xenococcus sp. PCC 7305]